MPGRPNKGAWRNGRPDPTSAATLKQIPVLTHPLWERQKGETDLNYKAFMTYRDLGGSRTLVHAREMLDRVVVRGGSYFDALSSKFRWRERVVAFDSWIDTTLLAAREDSMRQHAGLLVAREVEIKEKEYTLAMGLARKVEEMLKYPVTRVTRKREVTKGGKQITYLTIIEPAKWDWRAAADILQRLAYQARISVGMVTDGARAPTPEVTEGGLADIDAWLLEVGIPAPVKKGDG